MSKKSFVSIGIAGAGGIGSFLTELLYDYGMNRKQFPYAELSITVYDPEIVDQGNTLHQNYTFEHTDLAKVEVMADRFCVLPEQRKMTPEDFPKHDLVFSCVDNLSFRKALYHYGWDNPQADFFWIDGRCNSRQGAVLNAGTPRTELEPLIAAESTPANENGSCLLAYEKESKVCHTTPRTVASMMVQTYLNKLNGFRTPKMVFSL